MMLEELQAMTRYACIKDKKPEFEDVSDGIAEIAGHDGPQQARGKKDADFAWRARRIVLRILTVPLCKCRSRGSLCG